MEQIAVPVHLKSEHTESIEIVELPQIVLEKVFSYLTYDEVAKCREVSIPVFFDLIGLRFLNELVKLTLKTEISIGRKMCAHV